jgi:hydrogenase-4 membrane subunit HyfE
MLKWRNGRKYRGCRVQVSFVILFFSCLCSLSIYRTIFLLSHAPAKISSTHSPNILSLSFPIFLVVIIKVSSPVHTLFHSLYYLHMLA